LVDTLFAQDALVRSFERARIHLWLGKRRFYDWISDGRFVCARRPLLPSHVPAQSPGEMAPDYLSLWPVEWFKCNRWDQDWIGPGPTHARPTLARVLEGQQRNH
jgi:hypothetical protein